MSKFDLHLRYGHDHHLHVIGDISPAEKDAWSEWDGGCPGHPACIEDMSIYLCYGKRERLLQDPDGKLGEAIEDDVFYALEDI